MCPFKLLENAIALYVIILTIIIIVIIIIIIIITLITKILFITIMAIIKTTALTRKILIRNIYSISPLNAILIFIFITSPQILLITRFICTEFNVIEINDVDQRVEPRTSIISSDGEGDVVSASGAVVLVGEFPQEHII